MKSKFRWQWWAVTLGVFLIVIAIFSVKLYADRHAAAMAASKTHAKSVSEHEAAVASSRRHAARKASKRHVAAVSSRRRAAAEASREEAQSKAAQVGQNHIAEANQYAYPVAQVKQEMDAPYTSPIKEKVVFLTFDDGPNTVNSPKVLDILSQAGVHGTFFVVGKQVSPETAPVLKAEYDAGHAIGLHSMTHDYSLLYPSRVGATAVIENEAKPLSNRFWDRIFAVIFGDIRVVILAGRAWLPQMPRLVGLVSIGLIGMRQLAMHLVRRRSRRLRMRCCNTIYVP